MIANALELALIGDSVSFHEKPLTQQSKVELAELIKTKIKRGLFASLKRRHFNATHPIQDPTQNPTIVPTPIGHHLLIPSLTRL